MRTIARNETTSVASLQSRSKTISAGFTGACYGASIECPNSLDGRTGSPRTRLVVHVLLPGARFAADVPTQSFRRQEQVSRPESGPRIRRLFRYSRRLRWCRPGWRRFPRSAGVPRGVDAVHAAFPLSRSAVTQMNSSNPYWLAMAGAPNHSGGHCKGGVMPTDSASDVCAECFNRQIEQISVEISCLHKIPARSTQESSIRNAKRTSLRLQSWCHRGKHRRQGRAGH